MAAITGQEAIALLAVLLPLFLGSSPTEQEIVAFLTGIAPILGGSSTGSIPAFRVGSIAVGPIPYAPAT